VQYLIKSIELEDRRKATMEEDTGVVKLLSNERGGRLVVVTDACAGSGGKGMLNAWLATHYKFDVATNNWAPNAGHYVELDDGTRILTQHICSAFINPNILLYINAGAHIDIQILMNEIEHLESLGYSIRDRLYIHPHANVIVEEDRETEKRTIKSGSTFKGCGAALARKALRVPGQKLAKDYDELQPFIRDMTYELNAGLAKGMKILIEGSQGVDLDINHAEWPHCTSRQTIPTQLVADVGMPPNAVTNTILNVRTYPIRINNRSAANDEFCYTGNYWDADEISWKTVAERAGYTYEEFVGKYGNALMTSVTKKLRRVFEFPVDRMKFVHAIAGGLLNDGRLLYSLNFINFVDKDVTGVMTMDCLMTDKVKKWLDTYLYPVIGQDKLKWVRTGPRLSHMVEIE